MAHGAYIMVLLSIACSRSPARGADSAASRIGDSISVPQQGSLLYLDLASPSLVEPIGADAAAARTNKFVRIAVDSVVNPKKLPVSVRVDYAPAAGDRVHLGSFSLYPSDRPGTFIVATQGKVKDAGAIVLTLERPREAAPSDSLRLGVRRVSFVSR